MLIMYCLGRWKLMPNTWNFLFWQINWQLMDVYMTKSYKNNRMIHSVTRLQNYCLIYIWMQDFLYVGLLFLQIYMKVWLAVLLCRTFRWSHYVRGDCRQDARQREINTMYESPHRNCSSLSFMHQHSDQFYGSRLYSILVGISSKSFSTYLLGTLFQVYKHTSVSDGKVQREADFQWAD